MGGLAHGQDLVQDRPGRIVRRAAFAHARLVAQGADMLQRLAWIEAHAAAEIAV